MLKNILVTGGLGYIGSHCVVELIAAGYCPYIYDNLSNSNIEVLNRIHEISGTQPKFIQGDITDQRGLESTFEMCDFDAVLHFAGLKSVGESALKPVEYYENNVCGSIQLLKVMAVFNVKTLVFSSSATVYGEPQALPITETSPISTPTNPYGKSKLMVENILEDLCIADSEWSIARLRYFNPIGAHESGLIGEDPKGMPNNIMPHISRVASGLGGKLSIFGGDYATPDGTGIRDYIHVVDLVGGHIKALQQCEKETGVFTVNLGTGKGYSVLELVDAFSAVSGRELPYEIVARRLGDVAVCYADVSYAKEILGWEARRGLTDMCADVWNWQTLNPSGYKKP